VSDPGRRLAEDDGRLGPREDLRPQGLAVERLAIGLDHGQRGRVHLAQHVQLRHRPVPLAAHRQQLEQEDAMLGVGRVATHLVLQTVESLVEAAFTQ
jgi:hypothetical protein